MPRSSLAAVCFFPLVFAALEFAHGADEKGQRPGENAPLLMMPEPPLEFAVAKFAVIVDGELRGYRVQATKEDSVSKVMVLIDFSDHAERGRKVAATKAYVNTLAQELKGAELKLVASKIPDLEKSDFKNPILVELKFEDGQGLKIWVRKRILFTNRAYDITVIADNEEELKSLSEWAEQIRPSPRRQ